MGGRYYPPEEAEYRRLVRRDPRCYCGRMAPLLGTLEHVVPLSAGGPSTADNLVDACRRCNELKDALDLVTFLLVRVELSAAREWRRAYGAARKRVKSRRRLAARRRLAESAAPGGWMTATAV